MSPQWVYKLIGEAHTLNNSMNCNSGMIRQYQIKCSSNGTKNKFKKVQGESV